MNAAPAFLVLLGCAAVGVAIIVLVPVMMALTAYLTVFTS